MDTTIGIDINPTAEHEVLDVIPLLTDFKADLDGQTVYLVFHGGCPDGCLAAYIMRHEIQANYKPARLILFPTSHDTRNADMLEDGCTAIFVDVGPMLWDVEKLRACRYVIVMDHHASKQNIMLELEERVPNLYELSDYGGMECGATLVAKFCESHVVPEWIIHLFHHADVHEHELPDELLEHRDSFQGFITQNGIGRCTIELVQEFLAHPSEALQRGARLYTATAAYTRALFQQRELLTDTSVVSIYAVEMGQAPAAMDLELYQSLIDELATDKAVVFATLNRVRLSSGCWTIGLRRAGEHLDMGVVAFWLGECNFLGFKVGGGHPYAAGAQCENFDAPAQAICDLLAIICTAGPKETPHSAK